MKLFLKYFILFFVISSFNIFELPAKPPNIKKALSKLTIKKILNRSKGLRVKRTQKKIQKILAAWFITGGHRVADLHSCILDSSINPIYLAHNFYPSFNADTKNYETIVIGDSTGAINALTPGWMDRSKTQSVAVPGNHLCHDLMTFRKSIHTQNPKNIIVMTLGGNDLLAGIAPTKVLGYGKVLLEQLRIRFPKTKIIGIGIHPTLIRHANGLKDSFNYEMKAIWLNDKNSCYVDPLEAFQVKKGESAKLEHMFENDNIHYNSVITLRLGKLIRKQCLVDF